MPAPLPKHTFTAKPLEPAAYTKRTGRPPKPKMPQLPHFELTPYEQEWFDYFFNIHLEEYPDLTEGDKMQLLLADIEFIKYLRVAGAELASGEVISQARQHPGTMMNAILDRLAATRKQRQKQPRAEDDANADLLSRLGLVG